MSTNDSFNSEGTFKYLQALRTFWMTLSYRNHRGIVICLGSRQWGRAWASGAITQLGLSDAFWFNDAREDRSDVSLGTAKRLPLAKGKCLLGREVSCVVIDLHSGFDPDLLGIAAGAIKGGGLLFLICPGWFDWPISRARHKASIAHFPYRDRDVTCFFQNRLSRCLQLSPGVLTVTPEQANSNLSSFIHQERYEHSLFASPDQALAVEAIMKVATGRRRRPLVMTADRGRGKSSALGIAAGQLMASRAFTIAVIAPSRMACAPVMSHAARFLGQEVRPDGTVQYQESQLRYVSPADLATGMPDAQLVFVDEAAALPVEFLRRVLHHASRLVFSTTVNGYEGTGQGFAIRFRDVLEQKSPGWKSLVLQTPVRWAAGDPLEALIHRGLLLNVRSSELPVDPRPCEVLRVARADLVENEKMLEGLSGLLIEGHYKTSPGDLYRIIDAPNLEVFIACEEEDVVGAAVIATEGPFPSTLAREIFLGKRRPHGHLLPETLGAQMGIHDALFQKALRIVRIAVHPYRRRLGYGSKLLQAISALARTENVDYWGAAFGGTVPLLEFWTQFGFVPVRMGTRRGSSTGLFTAMCIAPVSVKGEAVFEAASRQFVDDGPLRLGDGLESLEIDVAHYLLSHFSRSSQGAPVHSNLDWSTLVGFGVGARSFEDALPSLWRLGGRLMTETPWPGCDESRAVFRTLLIRKVYQRWSWSKTSPTVALSGRGDGLRLLRSGILALLSQRSEPLIQALIQEMAGDSPPSVCTSS